MQEGPSPASIRSGLNSDGTRAIITVSGEIDIANSADLWNAMCSHIEEGRDISVDLGHVTFIDASGVSALVTACKSADERGVAMSIVHARHQAVARVLGVTRADLYLPLE